MRPAAQVALPLRGHSYPGQDRLSGAAILPLVFSGSACRLAGFVGQPHVFGVCGFVRCELVMEARNLLLVVSELGGCCRGSLAQRRKTVGQFGEVLWPVDPTPCGPPRRPGDVRPPPGGACGCAVDRGFGAARTVPAGVQYGICLFNGLLCPLAYFVPP